MEPSIVERPAQPYASITVRVSMQQLGEVVPPLTGEVFSWLAERGVAPAGPALWKYNVIDMTGELEIETGVTTETDVDGDDRVAGGILPAGRYAVARFHGHPDGLERATGELLEWGAQQGLVWDIKLVDGAERWVARLEEYLDDPDEKPDMNDWDTDLAFKLADRA